MDPQAAAVVSEAAAAAASGAQPPGPPGGPLVEQRAVGLGAGLEAVAARAEVEGLLLWWRSSSPTLDFRPSPEFLLDAAAWIGCTVTVLWIARKILVRRPRICSAVALAWLGWFGCQVFVITGYPALEAAQDRGATALVATKKLVHALVETNKAWLNFFLPCLPDMCWWVMQVWQRLVQVLQQLSREQQLMLGCSLLAGYAMVEVYRMYGRHKENVKMVFFHAFFLVAAPVMLYLSGLLPKGWLPACLSAAVTLVPTGFSLSVLAAPAQPRNGWGGSPRHRDSTYETVQQRRWLSYWACWPMLQACTTLLPDYVSFFTAHPDLQDLFYRAALVFVVWLQFWQGSKLLSFSMQGILRLLFHESVLDYCASWLGGYGKQALQAARGGLNLTCNWSLFGMMGLWRYMRRLWLWAVAGLVGVVVLVALARLFSRTLAVARTAFVVLLWCFVAIDSVDTLDKHDADLIARRLSFWVLAMLWELAATIPYIGVLVRMFTPLAFCLFLVAGELLLRRGVLPIVRWMQVPVTAAAESLRGRGLVAFGGLVGTLRSGMREMDERPAGEERLAPQPAKDSGGGPPAADSSSMRRSSSLGDTGGVGGDTDEAAEEAAGAQEAGAAAHGGATGGPCSPAAGDTAEPGEDAKEVNDDL